MKYKVTMICRETSRAVAIISGPEGMNMERIKDEAWADFDEICSDDLEQDNYTKVEILGEEV